MCITLNPNSTTENETNVENVRDLSPPGTPVPPELEEELLPQAAVHCVTSFAAFNQMRANARLCDIKLEVNGETINAHKVVLASASRYFYNMFIGDRLAHPRGIFRIYDIDVVTLKQLIDYIYTGELLLTEVNIRVLLPAAMLLQLHMVRETCCKFLLNRLKPSNCLVYTSFADTHSCEELHSACHTYALQHFQQVVETEQFLLLSFGEVLDLISNNLLNICSEETRAHAVLIWIKHDLDKRQKHIAELMSHVRLPSVNRQFLMNIAETETLMHDDPQCRELLMKAMECHGLPEEPSLKTQERRTEGTKPYVFTVGGFGSSNLNKCEVYNPQSNAWSNIAPMLARRYGSGITNLNKTSLYVMGGYDGSQYLTTAECYNPSTNKWSYITPMGTQRWGLGACSFGGLIYVSGGYDGASVLNSTECYDPLTTVWTSCPAMNTQRRHFSLVVVDNCFYCCGGEDSAKNSLTSVERFDTRLGRWYPVSSMTSPRSRYGVASCDGILYCIGGFDGSNSVSSGESFNVRTNTWEAIADMHASRRHHGLVEVDGCLYAMGGYNGSNSLNSVERYDIKLNKWTIINSMVEERHGFGAAVLDCFDLEGGLA